MQEVITELAAVVERYAIDGAQYARSIIGKKLMNMARVRPVTGLEESTISSGRSQKY